MWTESRKTADCEETWRFSRIILTVIFIVMCIALTVLVLMQEGKDAGLGAIAGGAETYWGKNKGRSMEGLLVKITKWLAIGFMVVAVILNITRIWV